MRIRDEMPADVEAISGLVTQAFAEAPHSSGTEAAIVEGLRAANALSLSLVAVDGDVLAGHLAVSPVGIAGSTGWFGPGPVAVLPRLQRRGIGAALITAALDRLKRQGAQGCVLVGEPAYYGRFGFTHQPRLSYGDIPPPYLQALAFAGPLPAGEVVYHPAFDCS